MSSWLPPDATEWGGRPVARTVAGARPRQRAVLSGVVVRVEEPGGRQGVRAALDDGTGIMALRWLGRRHVLGVTIGALLCVEGTVLLDRGHPVLWNPLYEVAVGPG